MAFRLNRMDLSTDPHMTWFYLEQTQYFSTFITAVKMFVTIVATQILLAILVYTFSTYAAAAPKKSSKTITSEMAWAATSAPGLEVHNDFLTQQMYPRRLGIRPFYASNGPVNV